MKADVIYALSRLTIPGAPGVNGLGYLRDVLLQMPPSACSTAKAQYPMPDVFCRHSLAIAWHHFHCPRIENGAGDNHTDFADTSPCNWYFAQIEREKEGNKHRNKQDKHGDKYSQCASRIPDHAREGSKHSGFIGRYNTDPRTGRGNEKCKKREIT